MSIDLRQKMTISPEALFQEVSGEMVILDLKSEQYFGLDDVGTHFWQLLQSNGNAQSAYEVMLAEYDVDADVLKTDIQNLLAELMDAGLVSVAIDTE